MEIFEYMNSEEAACQNVFMGIKPILFETCKLSDAIYLWKQGYNYVFNLEYRLVGTYKGIRNHLQCWGYCKDIKKSMKNIITMNNYKTTMKDVYDKEIRQAMENSYEEIREIMNKEETIKSLLKTDPKIFNKHSVFLWAVENNYGGLVEDLLNIIDPYITGSGFRTAAEKGHHKIVELLITDVDPGCFNDEAFRMACQNGHTEVVKILLQDEGVDPCVWDNWSIGVAAGNGHIEIVRLLLKDSRINPRARKYEAFRKALEGKHMEICGLLFSYIRFTDIKSLRILFH